MQQHLMQMQPMMAAYYPNNVTTDHIQQYLDENKSLILKIVESQNSGKLSECAENQARLQRNLMYLAAIADSQPQPPTMAGQYPSGGGMMQGQQQQGGAHYMQAQQMTQQQQLMAARSSLLFAQQQQQQPYSALQQHQLGGGGTSGLHMMQSEACSNMNVGGSSSSTLGSGGGFPDFIRGGGEGLHRSLIGGSGKQQEIGMSSSSDQGRGGGGDGGENLYLKSSDDGN
ncbi:putative transcription factor SSXT family [Medicago truncatula]|uniref:Putative transcription factor SSXT family n=1 Tax=Medicago truncatula TaxID=3880 RepID=A0A396H836_MEDTR|nr:GRF1-interacting factor 1 isoform X2 [Medicago truncatula]RHN49422.1 putative transcription factor SSXT family [Medicago truncatula]